MIRTRNAGGGGVDHQESEGEDSAAGAPSLALALAHAHSAKAEAYLEEQTKLTRLQIADLEREDKVRHWSLRVRHVSDVLKLAFELAAAAFVTIVVFFMLGAIWSAAHDNSLVIEAFDVPVSMATNGLSGEVVAKQVQDRLAWMQAHTDTIRQANAYSNNFADDIKVQIPDTGVSIGEFYRYLTNWLGHQTHITGEVWHGRKGLSLSVRSGAEAAATFTGAPERLPELVDEAAERIYWQTQPYRYLVFLDENGRHAESERFSKILARYGEPGERAWAYARLALSAEDDGDMISAIRYGHIAAALNPNLPHVWSNLAGAEAGFGHDEAELRDNQKAISLLEDPAAARQLAAYAVEDDLLSEGAMVSESLGDYTDAIAREKLLKTKPVYSGSDLSARLMLGVDQVLEHDSSAPANSYDDQVASLVALAGSQFSTDDPPLPVFERAAARGDWRMAQTSLSALLREPILAQKAMSWVRTVWIWPKLALADAMLGNFRGAEALIEKTPRDCYLCMRVRGQIAAQERNWRDAEADFAAATKLGPSIPFAYLEWGEMLRAKGDVDAAIAKFAIANQKGPHFADPLEMWGEALIAKNRSDLALAKFEEANKYAPNWGRLHLKWGEALWWSGDKDGAQKQFAAAGGLDLKPSERSELARLSHG